MNIMILPLMELKDQREIIKLHQQLGGIYFLWQGIFWIKYIVMVSGILMTGVFLTASISILLQLLKKEKIVNKLY
ncbi:MAG: hypothetical protein ACI93N_000212 [Flavobacteriaceae bacterium]|jgi:hypothetical protein